MCVCVFVGGLNFREQIGSQERKMMLEVSSGGRKKGGSEGRGKEAGSNMQEEEVQEAEDGERKC